MKPITFVTSNIHKVTYLEKYLGYPLKHVNLNLDEIQSLDVQKIIEHKVRQAYEKINKPVLVEDGSLEFVALGRLPGPFIRFFVEEVSMEMLCSLLNGKTRKAVARTTFGYFDGITVRFFEGMMEGEIALAPARENGWHWDKIFVPVGYTTTRAQFDDADYEKTSMQLRPLAEIKKFLESL